MAGTHIFISYRRDDSAGQAGRLYDRLVVPFGEAQVFMDVSMIRGGEEFTREIKAAMDRANFMLVVIGPRWLTLTGRDGRARLNDPNDVVRREIHIGLDSRLPIIPVLVGGAQMPTGNELPKELRPLTELNAISISDQRFNKDAEQLIEEIVQLSGVRVAVTPAAEIRPGTWEVGKSNYGMAPMTFRFDLRPDGTWSSQVGDLGFLGGIMGVLTAGDPATRNIMGNFTASLVEQGFWQYDQASRTLTLQTSIGSAGMATSGGRVRQFRITAGDRGVYQGYDEAADQIMLRRIGDGRTPGLG